MGKTKYEVRGKHHNANELVVLYEREETHQCRKYKCRYISLRARLVNIPVRVFLIKYGKNRNWNIMLCTDMEMSFVRAFELYQIRWNIEVLNKECKGYLSLGSYQGQNFNGQIADCTLCFITYIVLALGKRFSDYETMGDLFRMEREQLLALTLWKRILACLEKMLTVMAEIIGAEPLQMLQDLMNNKDNAKEIEVMADVLLKYHTETERVAA